MGLGLQGAYGAQGGRDALEELVAQRIKETLLKQAEEQRQFENQRALASESLNERQFGESTRRFDAQHGLDRDQFGFRQQQWSDEAPMRAANLDHTIAQTGELRRRPDAEAEARAHDVNMEGLRTTGRLRAIGAEGAEQRRTQSHGAGLKANATTAVSPYSAERARRAVASVDELIGTKQEDGTYVGGLLNNRTAGIGSWLSGLPATDARKVAGKLRTLGASIAFNELTEMREASKTGGALGAVSERELGLLESSLGALDQGLAPEDLFNELVKVRDSLTRWHEAKARYAGATSAQINTDTMGQMDTSGSASRVDELLKKYGGG